MNDWWTAEQTREFLPPRGPRLGNDGTPGLPPVRPHSISGSLLSSTHPGEGSLPRNLRDIQEHGIPVELGQPEYRSTSFARMAARRQSTMSRLGSRFLPNSVIRGLLSSEEETPAEGLAHRHGIISRSIPRSETAHGSSRFSTFSSLGSRGITRRRSTRAAYLFPRGDPTLVSDASNTPYFEPSNDPETNRGSRRRSARLDRIRNSLSNPISHMFGQSSSTAPNQNIRNSEHLPQSSAPGPDDDFPFFLPTLDTHMYYAVPHELNPLEPSQPNTRPLTPIPPPPGPPELGLSRTGPPRIMRPGEQTPLAHVLQLAASVIAAQLSSSAGAAVPNIQALGDDGLDGSFENFLQTLQQSAFAHANNQASSNGPGASGVNGPPSPVNFMRVFRVVNADYDSDGPFDGMDIDNPGEGQERRTVTLVVVGVRSVPSDNGTDGDQQTNAPSGLDGLLHLPFMAPGNVPRNTHNGPSAPPRSRFARGDHPAAGSSAPPTAVDATSETRVPSRFRRPSGPGTRSTASSLPTALSDSPPGPNPPPSTPADPGLSALPSGASTPSRRPSSASAMPLTSLPHLREYQSMQPTVESAQDGINGIPLNTARQRRRSDSEFARHRGLGSGAVRRNGVVGPDVPTPSAGRSWLIYVVGTNLSEDHPAFATPSLFTDVRTFLRTVLACGTNLLFRTQLTKI